MVVLVVLALGGCAVPSAQPVGPARIAQAGWLKHGDTVEVEIDRIGTLRNPVRAE